MEGTWKQYNGKTEARRVEDYTAAQGARYILGGMLIVLCCLLETAGRAAAEVGRGLACLLRFSWDWRKMIVQGLLAVGVGVAIPYVIVAIAWLVVG